MAHTKRASARVRNAVFTARAIGARDVASVTIALVLTRADRRAMARNMCARGNRAHKRAYRALCRAAHRRA